MTTILKKGDSIKSFERKIKRLKTKRLNAQKYLGVIKLKRDALTIQNELRNEWE